MRRLWDLLAKFNYGEPQFFVHLADGCKEDLRWWKVLLTDWNGKAFFLDCQWTTSSSLDLYTDANGSIGWRPYHASKHPWMHGSWTTEQSDLGITFKELYSIVIASTPGGPKWSCQHIQFCCDNEAVVACLASGTSRSPRVMSLLWSFFLICAKHDFMVTAVHILGKTNTIADA